jgi:hypothetical protein
MQQDSGEQNLSMTTEHRYYMDVFTPENHSLLPLPWSRHLLLYTKKDQGAGVSLAAFDNNTTNARSAMLVYPGRQHAKITTTPNL